MEKDYPSGKFTPAIGTELPLEAKIIEEKTRSLIAIILIATCILALIFSGIQGFYKGDYTALLVVWSVVSIPMGTVVTHYFRDRRTPGGGDDKEFNTRSTGAT